jgi:hypothetical protein
VACRVNELNLDLLLRSCIAAGKPPWAAQRAFPNGLAFLIGHGQPSKAARDLTRLKLVL